MMNRHARALVLAFAMVAQNAVAFAPSTYTQSLRLTVLSANERQAEQAVEAPAVEASAAAAPIAEASADEAKEVEKLIMDIPPTPVAPKKSAKKKANSHKEGVFSPIVVAASAVLGQQELIKVRAKIIAMHSDLIKSFVDTSDSAFGKAVLRQLFDLVDSDNSGYLDRDELAVALDLLGFSWLGEKQVDKIFARADADGNSEISMEEFMDEAPKTLKVNLIKLAKKNGDEMGLLV